MRSEIIKLGDLVNIDIGKTPSRNNPNYWDKEKKTTNIWVSIRDLSNIKNLYIEDSKEYISDQGAKLFEEVPKNTLIMSFKLSIGKLAITKKNLRTNEAIASLQIKDKNKLDQKYLYYFLLGTDWDYLSGDDIKIKGKTLNKKKLKEILINVPNLNTQHQIVRNLDKTLKQIEVLENLNLQKRNKSLILFSNLITELYFKDKNTLDVRLKDFADIKGGKRIPKGRKLLKTKTNYPYLRVKDFTEEGTINLASVKYITKDIYNLISRYTISTDDVYVSIAGTIGKTGRVPKILDNSNLTENAAKVVLDKKKCLRDYFYFFTISTSFENQAILQTRITAQPKMALSRLSEVKIPLPSIEKQNSIIRKAKEIFENKIHYLNLCKKERDKVLFLRNKILNKELNI